MITPSGFAKKRLLKKLFKNLPDNRILIDAGCAGSALSFDLDVQTKIALDFSLNLNARSRKTMLGIQCDIVQIPLKDNCVDYILCLDVLEHIENDSKTVGEFYRILKDGGLIVISTPFKDCENAPKLLRRFKLDSVRLNKDYGHVRTGYSIGELQILLKDFSILSYDSFDGTITRMLDLLIYRPFFKLYNHGIPFKQTYSNRTRRNKIIEHIEKVHDFLFPFVFGLPIIIGEKHARLEHFVVCEKK